MTREQFMELRRQGKSLDEIRQLAGQSIPPSLAHPTPAGNVQALRAAQPPSAAPPASTAQLPPTRTPQEADREFLMRQAIEMIPQLGGMIAGGGTLALTKNPWLASGASGSVGALLDPVRNAALSAAGLGERPTTPQSMLGTFLEQAATQQLGNLTGGAAKKWAQDWYSASFSGVPKSVARQAGDVVETGLKNRVRVSRTEGLPKATRLREQSAERTKQLIQSSQKRFRAEDFAGPSLKQAEELAGRSLTKQEARAVIENVRNEVARIVAERTGGAVKAGTTFTPRGTQALKKAATAENKRAIEALGAGNVNLNPEASLNVATGAKEALEAIPGVGASNARTQQLINLQKMVNEATLPGSPAMVRMPIPLVPFPVPMQRDLASRIASTLYNPAVRYPIGQAPRAAGYLGDIDEQLRLMLGGQP